MNTSIYTATTLIAASSLITLGLSPVAASPPPAPPMPYVAAAENRQAPTMPALVSVAGGSSFTVVLDQQGVLYGTGNNSWRQQTGSDNKNRNALTAMTPLPGGTAIQRVATGPYTTLAIGDDGVPYGIGELGSVLNTGRFQALKGLPEGVKAVRIAGGHRTQLVVGDDGDVYGQGDNYAGELTGTGRSKGQLTPLTGLPVGVRAIDVAASSARFTLVLGSDGKAYGTGGNGARQLTGPSGNRRALGLLRGLPVGVRAIAIAAGAQHSLVLGDNGQVYGAGENYQYQLARPERRDHATLTRLVGMPAGVRARSIAAGSTYSVVLGRNGVVYGAGGNGHGQLSGQGTRKALTPILGLPKGVKPIQVATTSQGTLVRAANGVVYGTGCNWVGQLTGNEKHWLQLRPLRIWQMGAIERPTVTGATVLGTALHADPGEWIPEPGTLTYQWLRNGKPILNATTATYEVRPGDVFGTVAVQVTAGRPGYRRVTAESTARLVTPQDQPHHVVAVAAAGNRSFVLAEDGRVYASGNGATALSVLDALPGGAKTTDLAAGETHTLLLGDDGRVYGFGEGRGGRLTGNNDVRRVPTLLRGLPADVRAVDITVGYAFSAVLGDNGVVYATGQGMFSNQQGDWLTKRSLTPVPGLPGGSSVVALHGHDYYLTVVTADGNAYTRTRSGSNYVLDWYALSGLPADVTATALVSGYGPARVIASDNRVYLPNRSTWLLKPVDLPGLGTPPRVAVGGSGSLAYVDTVGAVRGKGPSRAGQLTVPDLAVTLPVVLRGLPAGVSALDLAVTGDDTLVVGDDGAVYGTGRNWDGAITGPRGPRWGLQPLLWTLRPLQRPIITGVLRVGRTLSTSTGTWWPDPGGFAYQWYRNGNPVSGAVNSAYVLRKADLFAEMSVSVTAQRAAHRPRVVTVSTNDVVRPAK